MTAFDDWLVAAPVKSTVPLTLFPLLAYVSVSVGILASGIFVVQGRGTSLFTQLQVSVLASVCLGFGAVFTAISVGVYV